MKTIFVSSTFQDMHFERDAIQELVYPKLNQMARQYGQSVSFCDLRWGIDTSELESETGSRKVLDVCLEEIDRCQPPMVVILGDRYGWIPSENLVRDTVRRYSLELDDLEKSVTALEIEYGALGSDEKLQNTLFYFRRIQGPAPENYLAEDEEHQKRLQQLKDRIQKLVGSRVQYYTLTWNGSGFLGIEEFAQRMAEDLKQMLLPGWEKYEKMSPFQRELYTHASYLQEKEKMFRARGALVDQLLADIRAGKECTILKGEVGSGKSTLFSHLAVRLRQEGWEVFPLFSGLTVESNTAFSVLKLMVRFLEDRLQCGHLDDDASVVVESAPTEDTGSFTEKTSQQTEEQKERAADPLERWHMRLNSLCTQCSAMGDRLVFMLDAADQLFDDDARDKLVFLPEELSQQVRFVMTCLPELPVAGHPTTALPPVREDDKQQVIDGILAAHNRELPKEVISRMVALPAADNPLYLSFLVQRLLMMNKADFDSIHQRGDGMAAIARHQLSVIDSCPKNLQDMSAELMETAAQRINGRMIPRVLDHLALSQHGLRVTDLMGLVGSDFNMLDFTHFISYMADCFLLRDDGRYDFSHKSIREGLTERCQNRKALHDEIRAHLRSLDESDEISKRELLHHAIMADNKDYFIRYVRYCMNQSDRSYAYHAAMNCYMACLHDGGAWLCGLLEQAEQYPRAFLVAKFIATEFYRAAPGRLSELDMVLRVVLAAKELSERIFENDHLPESAQAVIHCCQALVDCYKLKDDGKLAYDTQIRRMALAVTLEEALPGPEHRRQALLECARAVQMYGKWASRDDSYISINAVLDFVRAHIKLRQPAPSDSQDAQRPVSMSTMEYIRCAWEELIEDDPTPERKLDLAAHYRHMAAIVSDKACASSYYEQAILLYRQQAGQQGQTWYHRMLVEVYGEYAKTLGSMYDKAQMHQLTEKRLELMEKLAEADKSVDFRKELAMTHLRYAKSLNTDDDDDDDKDNETRSCIVHHYRKALALLQTVVEERGTLWDLEELAQLCEDMIINSYPNLLCSEGLQLSLQALEIRKQLYEKMGRLKDLKLIYSLYHMAAFSCENDSEEAKYNALADEMEKLPEVFNHAKAYSEVLEVLRHMDKVYVNKLPASFVMKLYFGCSLNYDFRMTKSFAEENLTADALSILAIMNQNYWQSSDQAPKWENIGQLLSFLKF